jgi:hypothetical protein
VQPRRLGEEEDEARNLVGYHHLSILKWPADKMLCSDHSSREGHNYSLGLNLGSAPELEEFVGRGIELGLMKEYLNPHTASLRRNVVVLTGLGGVGKTQLAISFAKQNWTEYSAVFWLNAKSETSLKQDLVAMMASISRLDPPQDRTTATAAAGEGEIIEQVRKWLSEPDNSRWLLILDNYDNPMLFQTNDPDAYDLKLYFPHRYQGSIIVTTRSSLWTLGKQIKLRNFDDIELSLSILANTSCRAEARTGRISPSLQPVPMLTLIRSKRFETRRKVRWAPFSSCNSGSLSEAHTGHLYRISPSLRADMGRSATEQSRATRV